MEILGEFKVKIKGFVKDLKEEEIGEFERNLG